MTELLEQIQAAGQGWKSYTESGKLMALLLAALFYLWCHRNKVRKQPFLLYTTIMTICCILPVTAALLMMYQTRFYDYEWIWSLVPVTAAIAYGSTVFLEERWGGFQVKQWRRGMPVTVLLLAAVLISGSLGGEIGQAREGQKTERKQAYTVLQQVLELCPDGQICLWAPKEIMEYAREVDGRVILPYGRNMWDMSLNGFSYDTYDEGLIAMYRWMEEPVGMGQSGSTEPTNVTGQAERGSMSLRLCVQRALAAGVDCVLLPENTEAGIIQEMEKALDVNARLLEGYWIFYGRAD